MRLLSKIVFLSLFTYGAPHQGITAFLQRCTSSCNKEFCDVSTVCRPVNRTTKWSQMDIYFHPGIKLEAPITMEVITNKKFGTVYRQHMIKIKEEICAILLTRKHPFFRQFGIDENSVYGNMIDPCPLSGHRTRKFGYTNLKTDYVPLIPIGEWRVDAILSKTINGSNVQIVSWSDFYEIKPTSADQF